MQQLGISKGFEDIKLFLSFLPNENGDGNNFNIT